MCALHHEPLVTVEGYSLDPLVRVTLSDDYYKYAAKYPNPADPTFSRNKTELHSNSDKDTFCMSCERSLQKKLR
ncbi:hypothetical protein [Rubritalea tangerina]|uniref:hypothetical protein n=1 Tax=Rubritalea tangerina TaxID=430798 RepID=UPI0036184FFF